MRFIDLLMGKPSQRLASANKTAHKTNSTQSRTSHDRLAVFSLAIGLSLTASNSLDAEQVLFDTAASVACRDITTAEFSATHPGDRLLEAEFEISTLQRDNHRSDLELIVQVYSPRRAWQVVDYEPKSATAAEYTGNVTIEKSREHSAGFGIDGGGSFQKIADVTGTASAGTKQVETKRFEKPAPREQILSSGIMNRGAGVYYKVLATEQQFLEGGRRFTIRFRAPQNWRGDLLRVACLARKEDSRSRSPLDQERTLGTAHFVVAAYVAGDNDAKVAADHYVQAEFSLRQLAKQQRQEIRRQAYPNPLDKIGKSLGISEPKIPSDWLSEMIFGYSTHPTSFEDRLPAGLKSATRTWREARGELESLSGSLAQR